MILSSFPAQVCILSTLIQETKPLPKLLCAQFWDYSSLLSSGQFFYALSVHKKRMQQKKIFSLLLCLPQQIHHLQSKTDLLPSGIKYSNVDTLLSGPGYTNGFECIMCGVCLHSFCVTEANRQIEAAGGKQVKQTISAWWYAIIAARDALTSDVAKVECTLTFLCG